MILHHKTAIITGASSGLGAAISSALVEKGTTVYGLARSRKNLDILKEKLGKAFVPIDLDITDQEKVFSWAKETFSDTHNPDILINNAGVGHLSKIVDLSLEQWHEMMNVNLNGAFYMTSSIVPVMRTNPNSCHIINIGSILGKTTSSESAAYSATKYGMQGFSEALFKELRNYNIKVTCVNPGSIDTPFFKGSGIESNSHMLQTDEIAAFLIHVLETPDNMLIDEITLRPLQPKKKNRI